MKLILTMLTLSVGTLVVAQDNKENRIINELTLEEAVNEQYGELYPDALFMFSWIPNTDGFTYTDNTYQRLIKASVSNKIGEDFLTIQELNAALKSELYWFSGFEWLNENVFYVNNGTKYYQYNVKDKSGKLLHDIENGENPEFHSASQNIAYTKENNVYVETGQGVKYNVTDSKNPEIISGQSIAREEFGITKGLFWSPDASLLAFYRKDVSEVHDYPLLDITTTPGEVEFIKYPMTGQKSEKPSVGVFNLETKKTIFISPRGESDSYLTNLSWTPDSKFVVIAELNRDQNHMWLNLYDARTGKFVRTLFEEKNDKWVEPEHAAYFPLENSNNFVWISERDGFNNLYYYNIKGELISQLTDHDFVVKDIMEYKNGDLYYTTSGEDPRETQVYYVNLKKGKTGIITRANGTHTVHISTDGKHYHDHFSSNKMPSADWILRKNGTIVEKLLESYDKLGSYQIGSNELGSIKGVDGTKLYTRMIKPSFFNPNEKYPVMVYVYGGPRVQLIENSWLNGASLWMHWMAEQGYIIYTVDNRGSEGRGFAFESQIHRQLGEVEIEDQISGIEYLKTLPYIDTNRFAVQGWSYGGYMTTSLMLKRPGVFNVGVAGGPVTDWKYYEAMYGEHYMDRPEENEKGYEQASLLNHAGNLEGKLLLIHGTMDPTVVMQHNFALIKKFIELGKDMDFFPYPTHEHGVRGADRVHVRTKMLNYILEHNK